MWAWQQGHQSFMFMGQHKFNFAPLAAESRAALPGSKHRGDMLPLELKSAEMGLFLLSHFIHTDFMTTVEDTFDTQTKAKALRFPRSQTNTHPQPHEPSDTAMKCLVGKLWLLSAPNSSALINAAGLICAACPLTELQCIILPGTEHLHSTDLVEKMY